MTKLNKDQIRVEFIKLVSDENENQISSSNNRNSCVLLQSSALANNDFNYKKFANDKDKVGISLKDLNAFKNADITDFLRKWVDYLFFSNSKGKWNSKDNKNSWQTARDSSIVSIVIFKDKINYDGGIITNPTLNKQGKIQVNGLFISEYLPRLNKDTNPNLYLSFSELKQVCLSWFQKHKASDGSTTSVKGLTRDVKALQKIIQREIDNDFAERHVPSVFDSFTMLINEINNYRNIYKQMFPSNDKLIKDKKIA